MRKLYLLVIVVAMATATSCRAGKGCPTNGKNIGAERLLSGDPKALKAANRASKFRN